MLTRGASWRLIDTGPLDGAENMAIDEALLGAFDPERSAPALRLYGWSPPALSLGRFQDAGAVLDLERCRACNVPVVRRITGGGAVFHADELTYSLVCSPRRHLGGDGSVDRSYRLLNGFLLAFYRGLGLPAAYAENSPPGECRLGEPTAFCFAGRERADILVGGRKIGGNAQKRARNGLFQHGSIPTADRVSEGAGYLRETPAALDGTVTDLGTLGVSLPVKELKRRLAAAFEGAMGVKLIPATLSAGEEELARRARRQPPR